MLDDGVMAMFEDFWRAHSDRPLCGRNKILAGVCPQIYGLFIVKLAAMLAIAGGVPRVDDHGTRIRGELHMLIVGDPGTGEQLQQLEDLSYLDVPRCSMYDTLYMILLDDALKQERSGYR